MTIELAAVDFPSKYLNCYEATCMTIFRHLGITDETPLMGTQAYFVLSEADLCILPRFTSILDEWSRLHDLQVEIVIVAGEADFRNQIVNNLNRNVPIGLPVDIYGLPFTPHHNLLHQSHFVSIFGCRHNSYYVVCPYYRFKGWLSDQSVHDGFFSPIIGEYRYLTLITGLRLGDLPVEKCQNLVRENCQNMLGISSPPGLNFPATHRGLAGICTFSNVLKGITPQQYSEWCGEPLLTLSRLILEVGNSRYWFNRFIQTYCLPILASLVSPEDLNAQFNQVLDLWKAASMRVAASVHSNRPEEIQEAALKIDKIYNQEEYLFDLLLGALPSREVGTL